MCVSAINHARVKRVVFGAPDSKKSILTSSENLNLEFSFNHKCKMDGGILEKDCREILQSFFRLRRKNT